MLDHLQDLQRKLALRNGQDATKQDICRVEDGVSLQPALVPTCTTELHKPQRFVLFSR